ncbi:MAG: hypothetical protein NTY22_03455 [Proteobacteria bacterium]|nr:hypothetical protein [Pseudomonadota bacterium]
MRYTLYVCGIIICTSLLTNCAPTKSAIGNGNTALLCTDEVCVKNLCPSYKASSSSSDKTICKIIGDCEIPNMPLTLQLSIPVHGDLACAPTSTQMALDSFITNSAPTLSSWILTYNSMTTSTSVGGCSSSDMNCKKVVTIGNKLIGGSWQQNARAVSATEVSTLLETIKTETTPISDIYKTDIFPNNVTQCDYVTGEYAITNSQPWNDLVLYLSYEEVIESTSTYSGVPVTNIKFNDSENGHFIAMN